MRLIKILRLSLSALILVIAVWGYQSAVTKMMAAPRPSHSVEISLYLPVPAQLLSAVGDRYLAANIGVFRSFMVGTGQELSAATYDIVAKLQQDAAIFNGGHADNYYAAAALLPDTGHLSEAQYVLAQAQLMRPQDATPLYFYAFNQLYFEGDPLKASETLFKGAERLNDMSDRLSMQATATSWLSRIDWNQAIAIIRYMQKTTRNQELHRYMAKRILRLENYLQIRAASLRYQKDKGIIPKMPVDLVKEGYLAEVPKDPFAKEYYLDKQGQPTIRKPRPQKSS